jgi:geranylgeranyl diphosphate synthase type II
MAMMDLKVYLKDRKRLVDQALETALPPPERPPERLHEAMRYAMFAGGKRLRPVLAIAGAEAVGGTARDALPVALAVECIHTYSLVHDDLPMMDDDDMRRGVPSCHKAFDDAVAILVGDSLMTLAFELLADAALARRVGGLGLSAIIREVSVAAGTTGMTGGQAVDLASQGKDVDAETLLYLHRCKTGALLSASVVAGAMAAGASPESLLALREFGDKLGLAFQIVDDILDVMGNVEILGKPAGSDRRNGKATYPKVFGLSESRRQASRLIEEANAALALFGDSARVLRGVADYVLTERINRANSLPRVFEAERIRKTA